MSENPVVNRNGRLTSLDVVRGITMAGMILVNNPGDGEHRYAPLNHAEWNGWTPTDLVFPTFVFIMGVAITLSFHRRLAQGLSRLSLLLPVVRRSLIIFLLGVVMYGFPDWRLIGPYILMILGLGLLSRAGPRSPQGASSVAWPRPVVAVLFLTAGIAWFALDSAYFQTPHPPVTASDSTLRIPGVLQRLGVCYFCAAVVALCCGVRGRVVMVVLILVGYCWVLGNVESPVSYAETLADRPEGWLHEWIDVRLLGTHLYSERPDPEGILSTLPAIATTLIGVLAGNWLLARRDSHEKAAGLFFAANVLLLLGLWMNPWLPINKKIWTSSYVLLAGGLSLHLLAMCYWLIDVRGRRAWGRPFEVFGTNAIAVYVSSGLLARLLSTWRVAGPQGGTMSVRRWIYEHGFLSWASPVNASLAFAVAYVLVWLILLIPLYRRRLFIRV